MGPRLELAGDQRGAPEDADDDGGDQDGREAEQVQQPVGAGAEDKAAAVAGVQLLEEVVRIPTAVADAAPAAADRAAAVQTGEVRSGDGQQDRERGHDHCRAGGLKAGLTPGQPDQLATSRWWLWRPRPRASFM